MRMMLVAVAMMVAAAPAAAQATISAGMTPEQVNAAFGEPATVRQSGPWAYWYYLNGCPRTCGSDDVVFFREGRVVAAVLRTPRRRFAGPGAADALESAGGREQSGTVRAGTVRVGGIRVEGEFAETPGQLLIAPDRPRGEDDAEPVEGTPVPAREGRPGEPATTRIRSSEAVIVIEPADTASTAPAEPREETSVDRAHQRNVEERRNEETSIERARRHDRPRPPE